MSSLNLKLGMGQGHLNDFAVGLLWQGSDQGICADKQS